MSGKERRPGELGPLERLYLGEIARGLALTAWHFWKNIFMHTLHAFGLFRGIPAGVTVQYPEVRRAVPARARLVHRLRAREDGSPRCVACLLCMSVCPANCIHIVAEEAPDPAIEKRPAIFNIDVSRCVFCGFCVEACPVDAIRMDTGILPPAAYDRFRMTLTKEDMLGHEPSAGSIRSIAGKY
jgi:NADH-quinone oxidoreductase subunit I